MSLEYSIAISEENCRLRDENERLKAKLEMAEAIIAGDGVMIAGLKADEAQLRAEINEQARLLGISAEKELALLTKVEQLELERDRLLKGEYICKRCGLRKDNEHLTPGF